MSIKNITSKEIDLLFESLEVAKDKLIVPLEYLQDILDKKYKKTGYTDSDWQYIEKLEEKFSFIVTSLNNALDSSKRINSSLSSIKFPKQIFSFLGR